MQNIVQTVYHSREMLVKQPHFHDCHQIILILDGNVEFCVNGAISRAEAGDIAIFSRYENHSVRVQSAEYERYVLHIDPAVVNQKSGVYSLLTDRPIGFCNVIHVLPHWDEIVGVFKRILIEHKGTDELSEEMKQLAVKQLLITIYRCTDMRYDRLNDDVVFDVKRQFENNCTEKYALTNLAEQYSISVSSLSHRFRAVTGTSVMEYLQSCRIAQAKRLLADTNLSIGEIIENCGFSDSSNFSRTFKRLNGISPSNFRKKNKYPPV